MKDLLNDASEIRETASRRVLMVNSYFHPSTGGIENYLRNVGRELVSMGHRATVLASRSQPTLALRDVLDGIEIHRYVAKVRDVPFALANRPARIRACRQRLAELLKENSYDVAWVRDLESLAALISLRDRPPVLFIQAAAYGIFQKAIHGPAHSRRLRHLVYRAIEHSFNLHAGRALEKLLLSRCEGRVVLSEAKRQEISNEYGMCPEAFEAIPAGIDTGRFSPATQSERATIRRRLGLPDDAFVFLYVGRFSREKNPSGLLRAFAAMRSPTQVALAMVGPASDEFRREADAADTPGPLFLPGEVHEPTEWYRAADAFVLPSLTEGFGQVLLEAMASGLPIVGFRSPTASWVLATEEIVADGIMGALANYNEDLDMTAAMERLARNPVAAREMGLNGLAHCRATYSWKSVSERLLAASSRLDRH